MKEHWGGEQAFGEDDDDRIGASDLEMGQTFLPKPPRWYLAGEAGPRPRHTNGVNSTPVLRSPARSRG